MDCVFLVNVRCVLGNPTYLVLCLNGQTTTYFGFADGPSNYVMTLGLKPWVLYSPTSDLVILGGTCLGPAMKNPVEYNAMIGLLTEALTSEVSHIRVYLDSYLVVHQLNWVYTICNHLLLHMY